MGNLGTKELSSRAIIGRFYDKLELGASGWTDQLGMYFNSDQESETYPWLGNAPVMRRWIGGRDAKGFRANKIAVDNLLYESTLQIGVDELRRDKTGQIMLRIDEQSARANDHWATLLSSLILAAESTVCYDGQYFFDTDHSEGSSGSQSNDISWDLDVDGASIPSGEQGTTTAPGVRSAAMAIMKAIETMYGLKDDQGEPMNTGARNFLVMVPIPFWAIFQAAVTNQTLGAGVTNPLVAQNGFSVTVVANPRLTWTTKFAVFRTDGIVKPFIRQEEFGVQVDAVAEGSELAFTNRVHQYGISASRNVAYGYWQHGVLVTLA